MSPPRWSSALVTGASSGIGSAVTRRLASEGTDLVVVARDAPRLEVLADELSDTYGVRVEVLAADLSSPVSRYPVERRLADPEQPIDLLVNNAGSGTNGLFHTLAPEHEEQVVQVNVMAVLRLASAAVGTMVQRGSGAVLNIASIGGLYPVPGSATYGATKAFVCSFSDALHEELRGTGVTVTASLPGFTKTEFQRRADWDGQSSLPSWAWLDADDVARSSLDGVAAGRARVVPTLRYRTLSAVAAPVPPGARRWIMGRARSRLW